MVGVAALVAFAVWLAALGTPDGYLHLRALDVGQGDAILVETPSGRRMLVDAGPAERRVLDQLGRLEPPWERRLDAAVLTHPDADHVGGMASVVSRYDIALSLDSGAEVPSPEAQAWAAALTGAGVERQLVSKGARLVLDDTAGVVADVLWPPPAVGAPQGAGASGATPLAGIQPGSALATALETTNNRSVVLLVQYGRFRALLTGDLEAPVEEALMRSGLPLAASVLKVAHHGSNTSTLPDFVAQVNPVAAVISVGADNQFGHPTAQTLATLAHVPVWRTDEHGTVEFLSDGAGLWVRTARGGLPKELGPLERRGPPADAPARANRPVQ